MLFDPLKLIDRNKTDRQGLIERVNSNNEFIA